MRPRLPAAPSSGGDGYPLPETLMADQKITPTDALAALQTLRGQIAALPDSLDTQRSAALQQCDHVAALVKQALPKPGTYVTAGGAAAISGLAAVVGAIGGGLLGHKLGKASGAKALAESAATQRRPASAEEEADALESLAAEATARAKAMRPKHVNGKPRSPT
jgi:hypothetical protein